MTPYPVRPAVQSDLAFMALCCGQAQKDYWSSVGRPTVVWNITVQQKIMALSPLVAYDPATPKTSLGLILHNFNPPTATCIWVTSSTLPLQQRIGVSLSMLIAAYPLDVAAGCTIGVGEIEASNTPILQTLALVRNFKVEVRGRVAATAVGQGAPLVYHAEAALDDSYLAALKAALAAL
jgi:hypothetical protein